MISKRLSRLEATLAKPAEAAPVDMTSVRAQLNFLTAGAHPGRNKLERFAAALGVSVGRLWRLAATNDRRKFARLCGRLSRPVDEADAVACEIVQEFVRDEVRHRLAEIGVAIPCDGKAPLCRVRPLQAA